MNLRYYINSFSMHLFGEGGEKFYVEGFCIVEEIQALLEKKPPKSLS